MIDEGGGHINQHGLQLIGLVASNGSDQEGQDDDSKAQAEFCHGTRSVAVKESHHKWSKDNIMVYGMQLQLVIRIVCYFISLPFCLLCKDSPNMCLLSGAYV